MNHEPFLMAVASDRLNRWLALVAGLAVGLMMLVGAVDIVLTNIDVLGLDSRPVPSASEIIATLMVIAVFLGVPLAQQKPQDLIWIRGDFLSSMATHDRIIVHGHSITTDVQVMPNRIGIDTGAYYSGRLTCLVLEGESRRFITT